MDIAILGASGRVGKCLTKQILASDDHRLVGAYVSQDSRSLGRRIDGTDKHYQEIAASLEHTSDLIIDFSSPEATLSIIHDVTRRTKALVIGTTGMTQQEQQQIESAARLLPIMIGANFAQSFEPFVAICRELATIYSNEVPQLEETYHKRKKAVPSGTSLRLAREISDARKQAGCMVESKIPITVNRKGNVVGEHTCRIDMGAYKITVDFSVRGLDAYALGALQAGQWLLGRAIGLYVPADMLDAKQHDQG